MAQGTINLDSADSSSKMLPAAKRRRIDDAAKALAKPFRSPFKFPLSVRPEADCNARPGMLDSGKLPLKHSPADGEQPSSDYPVIPLTSKPTRTLHPSSPSSASNSVPEQDPRVASLLRTQRALESSLRNTRTEIDTLSQALKIAQSVQDAELEELIVKWRVASRAAAEEVFAKVRDRVNRMGGVGAWREREKKQDEWRREWDNERQEQDDKHEDDEEGDNDDDDEKEGKQEDADGDGSTEKKQARRKGRNEEYDVDEAPTVDQGRDDDSFTMDMMLRSLNIEPEVIGYDKVQQRWVD